MRVTALFRLRTARVVLVSRSIPRVIRHLSSMLDLGGRALKPIAILHAGGGRFALAVYTPFDALGLHAKHDEERANERTMKLHQYTQLPNAYIADQRSSRRRPQSGSHVDHHRH